MAVVDDGFGDNPKRVKKLTGAPAAEAAAGEMRMAVRWTPINK